jgi:hypothetical protein
MIHALCLFFLFTTKLFSWGFYGHRIVGQIASDELTTETRTKVLNYLPRGLANESLWADQVRSTPEWSHSEPWHFINIRDGYNYQSSRKNANGDAYTAINAMIAQFKNEKATFQEKQIALRFIIHLVGDLHQPLHVGRPQDFGGNRVKILFQGEELNLHQFWDSKVIIMPKGSNAFSYAQELRAQSIMYPGLNIQDDVDLEEVINENLNYRPFIYDYQLSLNYDYFENWQSLSNLEVVNSFYEKNSGGSNNSNNITILSEKYLQRHLFYVNQRLLLSGIRLAKILESLF